MDVSLATRLGWKCSFGYALKEYTVDSGESEVISFEWHFAMWTNLFLAMVASAIAAKVLRMDRTFADQYMAATSGSRRDRILKKHWKLRRIVIVASVTGFILAGLYGSVALYGTTLQSFWDVNVLSWLFW